MTPLVDVSLTLVLVFMVTMPLSMKLVHSSSLTPVELSAEGGTSRRTSGSASVSSSEVPDVVAGGSPEVLSVSPTSGASFRISDEQATHRASDQSQRAIVGPWHAHG